MINLDPAYFWFICGIIIILLEMVIFSVILLFISLASITLGGFLFFDIVGGEDYVIQAVIFFSSIIIWYLILYIPVKKYKLFKPEKPYKDIVGHRAYVIGELEKGKIGKVKWSGTTMKAMLDDNNKDNKLDNDMVVKIVSIEDNNILKVTKY